jgi:hypothetical protein
MDFYQDDWITYWLSQFSNDFLKFKLGYMLNIPSSKLIWWAKLYSTKLGQLAWSSTATSVLFSHEVFYSNFTLIYSKIERQNVKARALWYFRSFHSSIVIIWVGECFLFKHYLLMMTIVENYYINLILQRRLYIAQWNLYITSQLKIFLVHKLGWYKNYSYIWMHDCWMVYLLDWWYFC